MDSFRIFAGMVFAISVFLLVDAWVRDHQKAPAPPPATAAKQGDSATPVPSTPLGQAPNVAPRPADGKIARGERIRVVTDLLVAEIDTMGGDLRHLEFTKYWDTFDRQKRFVLLEETPEHTYVAQSGLIGEGLPNHTTLFRAAQESYELATDSDSIVVRLEALGANGVKVAKTYLFRRGSYVVDVAFETTNAASAAIEVSYGRLVAGQIAVTRAQRSCNGGASWIASARMIWVAVANSSARHESSAAPAAAFWRQARKAGAPASF
jgi:YidC/Oxa1 family membrane protein insertase